MHSKFHQHLPALFGLSSLISYSTRVIGTDTTTRVHYFWTVELKDFQFMSEEYIVISVVKTDLWTKGVVLIPEREKNVLNSHQPMHSIELTDWVDPVTKALSTIDLFPDETSKKTWGRPQAVFSLQFQNLHYSGEFSQHDYGTYAYSVHFHYFQTAIFSTLIYLAKLYKNEEMSVFAEYHRPMLYLTLYEFEKNLKKEDEK